MDMLLLFQWSTFRLCVVHRQKKKKRHLPVTHLIDAHKPCSLKLKDKNVRFIFVAVSSILENVLIVQEIKSRERQYNDILIL